MPATPHVERHFLGSESVRDVVIGMADGLTVPFALAAGLSAAVTSTQIIVTAGLAEIVAGAIAMGLGGYLAARTDQEHFASEERREAWEVDNMREAEVTEVRDIFSAYGLTGAALDSVVAALAADKKRWVDFMMRFELGLEKPDPKRAPISAATIAVSYLIRRSGPAGALHDHRRPSHGAAVLDLVHGRCVNHLRQHQGQADRDQRGEIRFPDFAGRRPRGGCRVLSCSSLWMTAFVSSRRMLLLAP